jgi:hypothetical protein
VSDLHLLTSRRSPRRLAASVAAFPSSSTRAALSSALFPAVPQAGARPAQFTILGTVRRKSP